MLVLTRKSGESIVIGRETEVKVLSVDGGSVRLGIEAPREVAIYRRELFEAIRAENIRSARSSGEMGRKLQEILKGKSK